MQVRLSAALQIPVILCSKNEPPHKGEHKEMSIRELCHFLFWVSGFFDLYVQDAENGAPVRVCACRYEAPSPEQENYYLPVRMQRGEAIPQVGAAHPAAEYVLHADTRIQHPHTEEWLPLTALTADAAIPFGAGLLAMQKSPACTQKFRHPAWRFPRIELPHLCKLTLERPCTLHLMVGKAKEEQFSLLVRGQNVRTAANTTRCTPKAKTPYQPTKRSQKKHKALPHLPHRVPRKRSLNTWQETKAWLYQQFENGDTLASLFNTGLNAHDLPTLAKLVNYPTQR